MATSARVVRAMRRLGWEVRRVGWDGWGPSKLRVLSSCTTVIDVGVCHGTPELYSAFPHAYLLMVDPLAESERAMQEVLRTRSGSYELVALGEAAGTLNLNVTADRAASSLNQRSDPSSFEIVGRGRRRSAHPGQPGRASQLPEPYLVKIDTEGHELSVLRGAIECLRRTDCVIAEVSVSERFENGYRFDEVVTFLATQDFHLRDILTVRRDSRTRQTTRLDLAFTRAIPT